jgi:hypothetical protein
MKQYFIKTVNINIIGGDIYTFLEKEEITPQYIQFLKDIGIEKLFIDILNDIEQNIEKISNEIERHNQLESDIVGLV